MADIPGEPSGAPYDPGPRGDGLDPYVPADVDNWDATTLPNTIEIGAAEQLLICDRSGFKIPVAEGLIQTWDGLFVRRASWEPRHALDFVRSRPESGQKGSPRPEPADVYLDTNEVEADDL